MPINQIDNAVKWLRTHGACPRDQVPALVRSTEALFGVGVTTGTPMPGERTPPGAVTDHITYCIWRTHAGRHVRPEAWVVVPVDY